MHKILKFIENTQLNELTFIDQIIKNNNITDQDKEYMIKQSFKHIAKKVFIGYITTVIKK